MIKLPSLFILALSMSSFGAYANVYPGANCKVVGSNQNLANYDSNGRILNASGREIKVICPITREKHKDGWLNITVHVADRSPTSNVSCDAYSAQTDGLGWKTTKSSSGYDPEWYKSQTLSFDSPSDVRDDGTFYLTCRLPASAEDGLSGILSYSVSERCRTDIIRVGTGNPPLLVPVTDCP